MGKLFGNGKGWHKESLRHREARIFGKASGKSKGKKSKSITGTSGSSNPRKKLVTMTRTRPEIIIVGKEKFVLPGLSLKEAREKASFERTIMRTPDYKSLQRQGWPRDAAINKVMKEKNIKTKPGTKWFDRQNLPPELRKKSIFVKL